MWHNKQTPYYDCVLRFVLEYVYTTLQEILNWYLFGYETMTYQNSPVTITNSKLYNNTYENSTENTIKYTMQIITAFVGDYNDYYTQIINSVIK